MVTGMVGSGGPDTSYLGKNLLTTLEYLIEKENLKYEGTKRKKYMVAL